MHWQADSLPLAPLGKPKMELKSKLHVRDVNSILGLRRFPGGGHGNPFQYSCLENPHGQRSLMGYGPQGQKESETTEAA